MRLRLQAPPVRSRPCRPLLALAAALSSLAASAPASAEECAPASGLSTCIDADNLWLHPGGGAFFAIGSTLTAPSGRSAFGLGASYLSRPIGLRVTSADPDGTVVFAVDNAVDTTFMWSVGVSDRLELTLALPVTVYQDGAGFSDILGSDDQLTRSVLRDGRLGVHFAILPRSRKGPDGGFGLSARADFGLPFGASEAFASAGSMVVAPSITADYRVGRLLLATEIGARIRGERRLAGATIGSQLGGALGASVDILPARFLTVGAEAFALYTLAAQEPARGDASGEAQGPLLVPAEWIASVSSAPVLGGDVVFALGGGMSIPTSSESALTAPRFRFNAAVRYAPTGRDVDADGVLDRDDRCVAVAEDRDGYQDDDGCPDPDNDADRIPDDRDRCRDAPETVDGFEDDDGCPDNDDDKDGIPDDSDTCRNLAEDIDKFEDADGCPDNDNDGDSIPDSADRCPNGAEDKDGFKDEDGCPDPDNDVDQVNDGDDLCPLLAEDRDGFKDTDGCPEPDNDEDGILDKPDRCPAQPETINGDDDEDGCPEDNARSLVSFAGDRVVIEKLARFAAGSADLSKDLAKQIGMAAQLIRGRAPIELVIVETYGDRAGDSGAAATTLADKRATAVKTALASGGIPEDRITAATGDLSARRPAGAPLIEITVTRATVQGKRR